MRLRTIHVDQVQVDQDLRKEVAIELRDVQSKISVLVGRKVSAEDQLDLRRGAVARRGKRWRASDLDWQR
ncbi:hypothetical protein [Mesorhizobium sp. WSM4904]|uniref:hypothetical protein n=1 Tax=Mesorhizobium sp. WSM4904 TaxID=3038545 RepID=UPI002418BBC4|nr:hypothetical protein [Mesorhizobium sp. WSM4904]WFP66231.1 hypothetical protein QAZ47_31335 [Mesorhizobium sp. WSM4904]